MTNESSSNNGLDNGNHASSNGNHTPPAAAPAAGNGSDDALVKKEMKKVPVMTFAQKFEVFSNALTFSLSIVTFILPYESLLDMFVYYHYFNWLYFSLDIVFELLYTRHLGNIAHHVAMLFVLRYPFIHRTYYYIVQSLALFELSSIFLALYHGTKKRIYQYLFAITFLTIRVCIGLPYLVNKFIISVEKHKFSDEEKADEYFMAWFKQFQILLVLLVALHVYWTFFILTKVRDAFSPKEKKKTKQT